MQKNTTLLIMAAGIGSRFGTGIKQFTPVGPNGETIMEYSVKAAKDAGFTKTVFIIRKEIEKEFQNIEKRISKITDTEYVFQDINNLPDGFQCPKERTKPWGTGHAVLAAADIINEPFLVINADDYYGKQIYVKMFTYLNKPWNNSKKTDICMAGFQLNKTLSESGGVTRGLCEIDKNDNLLSIKETKNIVKTKNGAGILYDDEYIKSLPDGLTASMNMWGFQPGIFSVLEKELINFLQSDNMESLASEFLLPDIIQRLIAEKIAAVKVLHTDDEWIGMTYQQDIEKVKQKLASIERS